MEEEKKDESKTIQTKEKTEVSNDEISAKTMVDKANDAVERMEKANAKTEELLKRQEAIKVQDTLGGKADAGKKTEETPQDYAKKVMANDL